MKDREKGRSVGCPVSKARSNHQHKPSQCGECRPTLLCDALQANMSTWHEDAQAVLVSIKLQVLANELVEDEVGIAQLWLWSGLYPLQVRVRGGGVGRM